MKAIIDALTEWAAFIAVFATQAALVAVLMVLMGLLVVPEHPLIVQCLKFLKGLV